MAYVPIPGFYESAHKEEHHPPSNGLVKGLGGLLLGSRLLASHGDHLFRANHLDQWQPSTGEVVVDQLPGDNAGNRNDPVPQFETTDV